MKKIIQRLLSSAALITGLTFGSTQANAYPFYFENTYEEQLWAFAEDIDSIDGYVVFLDQFRSSPFATQARARLAALAAEGERGSDNQIRLQITKRDRGFFGFLAAEGADPFARSFDLTYAG